MSDMNCPYCDAANEVCHDDGAGYSEDQQHEHVCRGCRKTFVFTTQISFHYESYRADCLNGSEHKLAMSTTYPRQFSMMRCKDCDYERKPTGAEFAEHGIEVAA